MVGGYRVYGDLQSVTATVKSRSQLKLWQFKTFMPKTLKIEEVNDILKNGTFDDLLGTVEDEYLECKAAPYSLKEEHQKQELAKDVAALANAEGGVILLGVRTERDPSHFGDEVREIRVFPEPLINTNQYDDILVSWIYPALQGVTVKWVPSAANGEKGIGVIYIPNQSPSKKPFLLTRMIDDKEKRIEVVFGYVQRKRASARHLSVQELHAALRDGFRNADLDAKIVGIHESINQLRLEVKPGGKRVEEATAVKLANTRVDEAQAAASLHDKPVYFLAAAPTTNAEITSIFQAQSEVVQHLNTPPEIRRGGFDLDVGATSRIIRGELRRAVNPGKLLELWRDGTLIFVADGGYDFLCWGRYAKTGSRLRINPIVLIESTYLFVTLGKTVFRNATPPTEGIQFWLGFGNMCIDTKPSYLIPGPVGSFGWEFGSGSHDAPACSQTFTIKWPKKELAPGEIAYLLVREVYRWFGFEDHHIPYTATVDDRIVIDAEKIRSLQ
jgi:hypothetical protein